VGDSEGASYDSYDKYIWHECIHTNTYIPLHKYIHTGGAYDSYDKLYTADRIKRAKGKYKTNTHRIESLRGSRLLETSRVFDAALFVN